MKEKETKQDRQDQQIREGNWEDQAALPAIETKSNADGTAAEKVLTEDTNGTFPINRHLLQAMTNTHKSRGEGYLFPATRADNMENNVTGKELISLNTKYEDPFNTDQTRLSLSFAQLLYDTEKNRPKQRRYIIEEYAAELIADYDYATKKKQNTEPDTEPTYNEPKLRITLGELAARTYGSATRRNVAHIYKDLDVLKNTRATVVFSAPDGREIAYNDSFINFRTISEVKHKIVYVLDEKGEPIKDEKGKEKVIKEYDVVNEKTAVRITFNPFYVYHYARNFASAPNDIMQRLAEVKINTEVFNSLLVHLWNVKGAKEAAAQAAGEEVRKEMEARKEKDNIVDDTIERAVAQAKEKAMTFSVGVEKLFNDYIRNKGHYYDRKKCLRVPRLLRDIEMAAMELGKIGLITNYEPKPSDKNGEIICHFVLNEGWERRAIELKQEKK